jgi:hypothetical protein
MRLTLPRLLGWAFWIICGTLLGLALERTWGKLGFFVGFVVGMMGGVIVLWAVLLGRLLLWFPLPICRRGRCHRFGKDYEWRSGTIYGWEGKGLYLYVCKCGDKYIRRAGRFMEVLPDGTRRPYQKLVGFRRWADDLDQ